MATTLLTSITSNQAVLSCKPVVSGMRMYLKRIIKMLASGIFHANTIDEYLLLEEDYMKVSILFLKTN